MLHVLAIILSEGENVVLKHFKEKGESECLRQD